MNHMNLHEENRNDPVYYNEARDEYSIDVPGYDGVSQLLYYCPWCGEKLPESKRDEWFDLLEAQGIDPMNDPIPEEFKTSAWRTKK